MNSNKVILIGLDSGTFDILKPMVDRGELPVIASIMESGVWGNLRSTIPSVTAPAWLSCFSGVNPGKLGIFYFTDDSHETYDEGPPADYSKVPVKLLWHLLSDNDKRVLGVIPFRLPQAKANGIMISHFGIDAESGTIDFKSYPHEIAQKLVYNFSGGFFERHKHVPPERARSSKDGYLSNVITTSRVQTEVTRELSLHLLTHYEWDFFITVFYSPDDIQHRFWSYMDSSHPLYQQKGKELYGDVIFDTYRQIDKALGDILEKTGDVTTIIVSDHGMGPIHKFFYANRWLRGKGFLKVRGNREKPAFSIMKIPLKSVLEKFHIRARGIPNFSIPLIRRKSLLISKEVDWSNTKAYATNFGININLEGREPQGTVRNDEYDNFCETLRREIYQLRDPETGETIIDHVYRREEIYSGPYLEDAPDIVYLFKQPFYYVKKDLFSSKAFKKIPSKEIITAHHINNPSLGIFIAKGPHINSQGFINNVHINDIAPTILYVMGLPIPSNIDGRILWETLQQGLRDEQPPIYADPEALQETMEGLIPEEQEKIIEELKKLGYI